MTPADRWRRPGEPEPWRGHPVCGCTRRALCPEHTRLAAEWDRARREAYRRHFPEYYR